MLHSSPGASPVYIGIDDQLDVAPRLPRALAQDDLARKGALAPVDVAGVVALAHRPDADDLVASAAPDRAVATRTPAGLISGQAHRVHRGVDDEIAVRAELARLLEQPEGKAGRDAKADVSIASRVALGFAGTRRPAPSAG